MFCNISVTSSIFYNYIFSSPLFCSALLSSALCSALSFLFSSLPFSSLLCSPLLSPSFLFPTPLRCVYALSGGVRRAHLLAPSKGALLKELYTRYCTLRCRLISTYIVMERYGDAAAMNHCSICLDLVQISANPYYLLFRAPSAIPFLTHFSHYLNQGRIWDLDCP